MKRPVYKLVITDDEEHNGVEFISLVDHPAIERGFQMFDNKKELFQVKDKDRRIVSGAAMVADLPIYRRDDRFGEHYVVFDKENIEKAVVRFFKEGRTKHVNGMHAAELSGLTIFESFIIDKERGIRTPDGFDELSEGSWFVSMKVDNDEMWENFIKTGKFKGFSIEGLFDPVKVKDEEEETIKDLADAINNFNQATTNRNYPDETYLKENDMKDVITKLKELTDKYSKKKEDAKKEKMGQATLVDGSLIEYDSEELAEGVELFIIVEGERMPAPDGDHETDGGIVITTEGGKVTAIAGEQPTEEEKKHEEEEKAKEKEEVLNKIVSSLEELTKKVDSFDEAKKETDERFEKTEKLTKDLFELVEKLAKLPGDDPEKKDKKKVESLTEMRANFRSSMKEVLNPNIKN